MRFMILRKADASTEAGVLPSKELLEVMGRYMEELAKAGVLLAGDGLQPTSKGARVKLERGKPRVIDGPFAETKELVAGFLILQVKSREEAIEWARRWPPLDGDVELEVRPLYEASDFPDEIFPPEEKAKEERLRASLDAQAR